MKMRKLSALTLFLALSCAWPQVASAMRQLLAIADGQATASADLKSSLGVVVEKVAANSVAEKAALQPGDILLRWTRGDATGELESPFDVSLIDIEQSPRGAVKFEGLRGTEKREWTLAPGDWGLKTQPNFQGNLLFLYREGQQLADAGKPAEAAERWRAAAGQVDQSAPAWLHLWLLSHAADVRAEARQWKEADAAYEEVIALGTEAGAQIKGQLLRAWAATFRQRADLANAEKHYRDAAKEIENLNSEDLTFADTLDQIAYPTFRRGDLAQAESYYSQALRIQQELAPGSLAVAKTLNGFGNLARTRGGLDKAEEYFSQALVIRKKLAPGSLEFASNLYNLGAVAQDRSDLAKAEEYFRQVLEIREKYAPNSLELAGTLNALGVVAWDRGDLTRAEEYYLQALSIKEKLAPGSLDVTGILDNLGSIAWYRGDLAKAENYSRRALAIKEKLAPGSLDVAITLNSLGAEAWKRGDLDGAERYYRKALAIRLKLAPDGVEAGTSMNNLGDVAWRRGDLARAEEYYRKALAIKEKVPGSLTVAASLNNLGAVAHDRGDMVGAEQYERQALEIREKLAPGSLDVAESLTDLGDVARDRGDWQKAEEGYHQARVILEKLAPESKEYAEVLADLAGIMLRKGQVDAAAPLFDQALTALESQTAHLGGSEDIRSNYRAAFLNYYRDYMDLLIRRKQPKLAFQVLERSRARGLLEMLTAAHIDIHKGVDAALLDEQRSLRADLSAKYDRRIRLLSGKHSDEQIATINQEIEKLLAKHKDVEGQILASSPGYAAFTQPRSLSIKEIQQLLDNDTLLLEYSLGAERSYVFALTSGSLEVFPLPKGAELETTARRASQELRVNNPAEDYEATKALSSTLLGPMIERLDKKRLAIVADGALQYIPFEALRTLQGAPLVAEHEVISLPSASTLDVLRRQMEARSAAPRQVAVFADPVFDANDARLKQALAADSQKNDPKKNNSPKTLAQDKADPAAVAAADSTAADLLTRSATDLGMTAKGAVYLPRLLSSREEAKNILALARAGQSMQALDFDATRAIAISPALAQYRIVHFATHGLANSTHPELSGLVLSLVNEKGEQQNGFLSIEDIYNMNLPADLVVLSACGTGLGREIQGEGLVSLARAFMYAGTPRVVASLWRVPDRATAELMKRFYTGMLVDRLRPAAALRQAQMSLSKEKRWSAPYYWAGFTLQGEWK